MLSAVEQPLNEHKKARSGPDDDEVAVLGSYCFEPSQPWTKRWSELEDMNASALWHMSVRNILGEIYSYFYGRSQRIRSYIPVAAFAQWTREWKKICGKKAIWQEERGNNFSETAPTKPITAVKITSSSNIWKFSHKDVRIVSYNTATFYC